MRFNHTTVFPLLNARALIHFKGLLTRRLIEAGEAGRLLINNKEHTWRPYEKSSVVKGHHVYKFVWTPVIGQELKTKLEEHNEHDKHAVAVLLDD